MIVPGRTPKTEIMNLQFIRSSAILAFSAHVAGDAPVPQSQGCNVNQVIPWAGNEIRTGLST